MSEERIAEVALISVKVPKIVKVVLNELMYVDFGGEKTKLHNMSDIIREAVMKGLHLMCLERMLYDELVEHQANEGLKHIASLLKEPEEDK